MQPHGQHKLISRIPTCVFANAPRKDTTTSVPHVGDDKHQRPTCRFAAGLEGELPAADELSRFGFFLRTGLASVSSAFTTPDGIRGYGMALKWTCIRSGLVCVDPNKSSHRISHVQMSLSMRQPTMNTTYVLQHRSPTAPLQVHSINVTCFMYASIASCTVGRSS